MAGAVVKHEFPPSFSPRNTNPTSSVISISSTEISGSSDVFSDEDDDAKSSDKRHSTTSFENSAGPPKKPKVEIADSPVIVMPIRSVDPSSGYNQLQLSAPANGGGIATFHDNDDTRLKRCKHFWKAGDYDGGLAPQSQPTSNGGMDHVRVHPRFLHSNATSHKWALGAFAELLDNSLDEVRTGASYVIVDMLLNEKDDSKMLLVQDNGGGMNPDKMRQCMSLGYSAKSKLADTIGQYGNGFKTSTMRLGADVIVFSCCQGKDGSCPTKSIGLLSYTFLRSTGMEDIVVPMIDFEKREQEWKKIIRTSGDDWHKNLETITKWSPYSSEEELLLQFQSLDKQGTRIIIYNLWEDEEGHLELDFDEDIHDIQIRGVNRDNNKILLAQQFPNAKHFLTYRHSLRSYAGILYLRLPPGYRIILRGKDVVHHNLINDMTHSMEHIYRPQLVGDDGARSSVDMVAVVTLGFVKDAEAHINIQGFSVYHKNRLIKPFWRVWNAAGSDGRGVIGVLEANFIEPAHDKQGFERTIVLSRLETRLIKLQKDFWRDNCHKVGYAPRRQLKNITPAAREPTLANKSRPTKTGNENIPHENGHALRNRTPGAKSASYFENDSSSRDNSSENDPTNKHQESPLQSTPCVKNTRETSSSSYPDTSIFVLRKENADLKERLLGVGGSKMADFQRALEIEKEQCKSLEAQILKAQKKIEELGNEQEALVRIFTEERNQRDVEEEKLRKRLQAASTTIKELEEKVKLLERKRVPSSKKK